MAYVIAEPCVDVNDKACIEECPVDCIYQGARMLYIHPDECVDCGACEPVCPVEAIYYEDDLPDRLHPDQRRLLHGARLTRRRVENRDHRKRPNRGQKSGPRRQRLNVAHDPYWPAISSGRSVGRLTVGERGLGRGLGTVRTRTASHRRPRRAAGPRARCIHA